MKLKLNEVYAVHPQIRFSFGKSPFFGGLEMRVAIWRRGYALYITTKKRYQEYLDQMRPLEVDL